MSSIDENTVKLTESPKKMNSSDSIERYVPLIPETHPLRSFRTSSEFLDRTESLSALEIDGEGDHETNGTQDARPDYINLTGITPEDITIQAAQMIGHKLSEAVISTPADKPNGEGEAEGVFFTEKEGAINEYRSSSPTTTIDQPVTQFISPADLAVQLTSNPKLAALRSPTLLTSPSHSSSFKPIPFSSPILVNPKCSGYFVEPVSVSWLFARDFILTIDDR